MSEPSRNTPCSATRDQWCEQQDAHRSLEAQGLVRREVCQTAPVAVQYALTPFGRSALGLLDELRKWTETLPEEPGGA